MNFSEQAVSPTIEISDFPNPFVLRKQIHLDCILLVDDDRATNFLNKRLLDRMGVADTISIARNGLEAMDYLERAFKGERDCPVPELIFLDINMPLVNGWEFLERYEQMPDDFKQSIAVMMLTTSLRNDDLERANQIPTIRGFIHKPLTEQGVQEVLEKNFGRLN